MPEVADVHEHECTHRQEQGALRNQDGPNNRQGNVLSENELNVAEHDIVLGRTKLKDQLVDADPKRQQLA